MRSFLKRNNILWCFYSIDKHFKPEKIIKKGLVYIFTIILYFKNMDRLVAGWNIKDSFKYLMVFCRVF